MIAYFDSSAFVKVLLREPGSDQSREIFFTSTRVFSSRLLVPEASAALGRATRTGRLGTRSATKARDLARSLLEEITLVEVSAVLADRAWDLASTLALRGYEAVHLASFERVESENTVLVTSDGDLARAALSLGHAVAVPA
ncbi:MAG: type II toxin-antitoxin system VapC family toxin [Gaiellaceae bacterium]